MSNSLRKIRRNAAQQRRLLKFFRHTLDHMAYETFGPWFKRRNIPFLVADGELMVPESEMSEVKARVERFAKGDLTAFDD